MEQNCKEIKVASLNFSGINTNPFEYNDGSPFFLTLNLNYQTIRKKQFPDLKKWIGVNLDKHYKKNRFTVLNSDILIQHLHGKLFSKEQFEQKWMQYYSQARKQVKEEMENEPTKQQEEDVMKMDYSFYRAVAMTAYDYKTLQEFHEKSPSENAQKLKQFLISFKNRPPFKLDIKKQMAEKYAATVDAMFIQEGGTVEWSPIEGYTTITCEDSVIIYKTEVFGKPNEEEGKKWTEKLNINDDTAFVITDKHYLLISSHFTSREAGYLQNTKQFYEVLNDVLTYYESNKEFNFIVGIDANHFLENPQIKGNISIIPTDKSHSTTIKKRTFIQAQLHKADICVNEVKDHIISTLAIKDHRTALVDGKEAKDTLLPNNEHPYDHFILEATLKIKKSD